jgi:hypothetical protein
MTLNNSLNKREQLELVDLLRKNLLYQTPQPRFANPDDDEPAHVSVRMVFQHYQRVLELCNKAGGWALPLCEKHKIFQQHEEASRAAHGNGVGYDFSHLNYGALVAMYIELEGIDDLTPFREAIAAEIGSLDAREVLEHG